jgi:hypothetical protein
MFQALLLIILALGPSGAGAYTGFRTPERYMPQAMAGIALTSLEDLDHTVYLPIVTKTLDNGISTGLPRINLPYFPDGMRFPQAAIHWFGEVRAERNYTDMRLGYTAEEFVIQLSIFDRHAWYDTSPSADTLTEWDAATIYLDTSDPGAAALSEDSYKFVGQLNWWEGRENYQAAYRGGPSGWTQSAIPFSTTTAMRGVLWNDNSEDDRGWKINFRIPYSSLGLESPPAHETLWRMAVTVFDRDNANGALIPPVNWPESVDLQDPSSWGILHFGLPVYSPPNSGAQSTWVIRHNLNANVVPDAGVGGDTICGNGLDFWNEWGDTNYAHKIHTNIQNQSDVADWPCFSKHYLTFPLDSLPPGRVVVSGTLTLHQFGGSDPTQAEPSLIQVLTVGGDWNEGTITWNNAPLALENIGRAWVEPLLAFPGWPGVPAQWDLSYAANQAYTAGTPLRLALYSADGAYHSGKYFSTSDVGDWNAVARPTLTILLGEPLAP